MTNIRTAHDVEYHGWTLPAGSLVEVTGESYGDYTTVRVGNNPDLACLGLPVGRNLGLPDSAIPKWFEIKRGAMVLWNTDSRVEALRQVLRFRNLERTFGTNRPIVMERIA